MTKTNLMNSILFMTDSYKVSMWKQYPTNTEYVFSYIEARGNDDTLFFGLQSYIKNYLMERVTVEQVEQANKYWTAHGEPFNYEGWMYIAKELKGRLPIHIKAPKEGLVIPSKNALVTIVNTDPKCFWLTTWVEGALLRGVWYPTSVASTSRKIIKVIGEYLEKSGDITGLPFKLHDFGFRGCSSNETASLGAAAHLINSMGTDTYVGVLRLMQDYGATFDNCGFSIPASEHSTITSWGRAYEVDAYANMIEQFSKPGATYAVVSVSEHSTITSWGRAYEVDAYANMIEQFSKPGATYAVVSDSYNIYNAAKMWGTELIDKVISSGGTLVIRPDSGDPIDVLPKLINILADKFGFTVNDKGYKVLNNVRIIWGDGINYRSIVAILQHMVDYLGWSCDNFAFGMGGALLGAPQRDDNGWAMKCCAVAIRDADGILVWRDVFKDPITDSGKKSKRGVLDLQYSLLDSQYRTISEAGMELDTDPRKFKWCSVLEDTYLDGNLMRDQTIYEIRDLAKR